MDDKESGDGADAYHILMYWTGSDESIFARHLRSTSLHSFLEDFLVMSLSVCPTKNGGKLLITMDAYNKTLSLFGFVSVWSLSLTKSTYLFFFFGLSSLRSLVHSALTGQFHPPRNFLFILSVAIRISDCCCGLTATTGATNGAG